MRLVMIHVGDRQHNRAACNGVGLTIDRFTFGKHRRSLALVSSALEEGGAERLPFL